MKVYFACSIRGGRDDHAIYAQIVEVIRTHAIVLSEAFADKAVTDRGTPGNVNDIWKQDMAWLKEADAIIAEVTNPSLGVGYEIAKAEEMGKPVLALFRPSSSRSLSAMIAGSAKVTTVIYEDIDEASVAIKAFLGRL